jgi:hypothetical protein
MLLAAPVVVWLGWRVSGIRTRLHKGWILREDDL